MQILITIFLFLVCLAVAELYFISMIVRRIGFLNTVIVVLGTGVIGAVIARKNAKIALKNLVKGNFQSQAPGRQIFDAVVFFIAAALLILPGIITDAFGLLLLFPFIRGMLYQYFSSGKKERGQSSNFYTSNSSASSVPSSRNTLGADEVIDIEAEDA